MLTRLALVLAGALVNAAPLQARASQKAGSPAGPRLSSSYVNLQQCHNLWRAPANAPEGSDEPIECAAPGGYLAGEQYSAATTWHVVSHRKVDFQLSILPATGVAWSAAPVMEFRLCDGRPFAVIQRIEVRDEDAAAADESCAGRRCGRSLLIVEGLVGLDGHHAEIAAGPKANEQARQTADGWIVERGCPAAPAQAKKR